MADDTLLLAKRITDARDLLDEAYAVAKTAAEREKIRRERVRLKKELQRLISIRIQAEGEEYDAATEALAKANTKLRKAIADQAKLAEAIEALAHALDLVALVRPVL
jgi:hypothetical protein